MRAESSRDSAGVSMRGFVVVICALMPTLSAWAAEPAVDFERDVLPILKARCFECHDAEKQISGYRLDVRRIAFEGGESGEKAIVPGKSDKSELIRRVTADDEFTQMPPEGARL